ncbi:MAG: hypothetical protein HOK83_13935 [Rhodospirillaceae bacterium]|nr:hypothetical protein [Rhodospirillaceae bacterium]
MIRLFTHHPETVGETYLEHMAVASSFGFRMFFASLACIVHAFLPFLCVKTGSAAITQLHDRMVTNRHNQTAAAVDRQSAMAGSD